jgi:hypothetical protein
MTPLPTINTGNTGFMILCASLVMLMTPGLAFFYGGLVSRKNVLGVMIQSFVSMGWTTVIWFTFGYSMSFGPTIHGVIGDPFTHAFLRGITLQSLYLGDAQLGIPTFVHVAYQMMFAIITPALITGAFANRVTFKAYMLFLTAWLILVYFPFCHMIWHQDGLLAKWGVLDYAGGIVVHNTAGMAALASVLYVGKRKVVDSVPHSIPLVALGTGLLWFGWYGFNAGSEFQVDSHLLLRREAGRASPSRSDKTSPGSTAANRQTKAVLDTPYFTPSSFLLDVNYTASRRTTPSTTRSSARPRSRGTTRNHARVPRLRRRLPLRARARPPDDPVRRPLDARPAQRRSTNRGQFDLQTALRYVSEAYGGYHWDALHGINLDAGIFMSYVGLFSYDNFENWMYLPSFTSDNTPWFFNGMRLQIFTSDKLKIEPWLINGWQSYGKFNEMPGFGAQVLWRPVEWLSSALERLRGLGHAGRPGRTRFHTDNSLEVRYFHDTEQALSGRAGVLAHGRHRRRAGRRRDAVRWTPHEQPASCTTSTSVPAALPQLDGSTTASGSSTSLAWTVGGGMMHNPGRYLVLAPTGNATPFAGSSSRSASQPGQRGLPLNPGTTFDAFDYETGIQVHAQRAGSRTTSSSTIVRRATRTSPATAA